MFFLHCELFIYSYIDSFQQSQPVAPTMTNKFPLGPLASMITHPSVTVPVPPVNYGPAVPQSTAGAMFTGPTTGAISIGKN